MTESEILDRKDSATMLAYLQSQQGDRRVRLVCVGCCRQLWDLLADDQRLIVEMAEKQVERMGNDVDIRRSFLEAQVLVVKNHRHDPADLAIFCSSSLALAEIEDRSRCFQSSRDAVTPAMFATHENAETVHRERLARVLRCVFGNPFKAIAFDPAWRTANVTKQAQGIYEERAFERMAVLGDALEETGCTSPEILNHCRAKGVHVRGCWVVDGVLAKE